MNMNFINAMAALSQITEGKDDYLEKNKEYILKHKSDVKKFADWLKENLPELFENIDIELFDEMIEEHDDSKFSDEEFEPYAQKWFGDGKKTFEYEAAWEHHWQNNEHHPEYWLGEDMPYIYILEMICDWGSFSIKSGNMKELSDFYYNKAINDPEKNLSEATKEIIEDILSQIDSVIE
jgi:uncharacterized protein (DUF2164 family)